MLVLVVASRVHEADVAGDNSEAAAVLPGGLILPLVVAETSLDEHGTAFFQVLRTGFRLASENLDIHEGGLVAIFAARRAVAVVDSESQFADGRAARQLFETWISGEIAHQKHFVQGCHEFLLLLVKTRTSDRAVWV